ncbi:MAG: hypothetical protein ACPLXL_01125 [Minisyncoccia bacterium]
MKNQRQEEISQLFSVLRKEVYVSNPNSCLLRNKAEEIADNLGITLLRRCKLDGELNNLIALVKEAEKNLNGDLKLIYNLIIAKFTLYFTGKITLEEVERVIRLGCSLYRDSIRIKSAKFLLFLLKNNMSEIKKLKAEIRSKEAVEAVGEKEIKNFVLSID